ncbi:alpha-ribazole phosphatase [Thioclava dalianensis]|uniref:Alpha-ribazole phosphatase n=1 Tax=Thioclava dalianensis TaxID=1185766 RepID=A0A074TD90_9RHOB|nr:alpha-ribazole phosphatase [Thioclava dalianensis]
MTRDSLRELWMIRHAPTRSDGGLCGRRDLPADCPAPDRFDDLRARLPGAARRLRSPALRCVQTAQAIWAEGWQDAAQLWEQDFGVWEGRPFADLPDLGPLSQADLAAHRPPEGESFADLCARVRPALAKLEGDSVIVAHAGTIRAALALALGTVPPALSFEIAPLSLSRIALLPEGGGIVREVNRCP